MEDGCIFCAIVAGTAPAERVYEDTGRAAWQSVFHFHLHLVPRREGDGMVPPWSLSPPRAEEATLRTVADNIRSAGEDRDTVE
jgi:diadenosine tetraphosphate (Ap4A) HIT family hydrolase